MSKTACFGFLRPVTIRQVYTKISPPKQTAYLQFYTAVRRFGNSVPVQDISVSGGTLDAKAGARASENDVFQDCGIQTSRSADRDDVRRRVEELQAVQALRYPRIGSSAYAISCAEFRERYYFVKAQESREEELITLRGRLYSSRMAGSKLAFMDIVQDGSRVQGICNLKRLEAIGINANDFRKFCQLARRGDIISITGYVTRTQRGELSLLATELPTLLTPILATLPIVLDDPEARIRHRHADLLVNHRVADTLKLRSRITQYLRDFLIEDEFLEVQTPILADGAGGATARPFVTVATEFTDRQLSLRIAPELWLKRLVLGGMDRVFEIGPAFRNEGLDASHNPEFTTCEFYKAFADLDNLMEMTENLVSGLANHVVQLILTQHTSLPILDATRYKTPYQRIEFVPALEAATQRKLPHLQSKEASENLISIFHDLHISLPTSPTLPRLLDKLSSIYLEPQCEGPTFIVHQPACLAPLSKSFQDAISGQVVSARAELFIQGQEIANMYEEENSPIDQRKKFLEQAQWRDTENSAAIDESYLEALEWALPPTGGWGCGVDRLCMHFAGASKISQVLSFGNLRNVVGLARA